MYSICSLFFFPIKKHIPSTSWELKICLLSCVTSQLTFCSYRTQGQVPLSKNYFSLPSQAKSSAAGLHPHTAFPQQASPVPHMTNDLVHLILNRAGSVSQCIMHLMLLCTLKMFKKCSCGSVVEHCVSSAKVVGLIPREHMY